MKKSYTLVLMMLCLFGFKSSAQESIIGEVNYGLLERYISAAKEYYPRKKLYDAQAEGAKAAVTIAKISYLDPFSVNYFYRPDGTAASGTSTGGTIGGQTNVIIGNGFQYGISVNLGNYLSKPFQVKRAKSELKVAQFQSQDYAILLEIEVKKRYYTYLQMLNELKIRTLKSQDNKSVADNARRRFEKGEIALDIYNGSRIMLADADTERLQTEVNFLVARDALEEMIGKKLAEFK